MDRGRALKRVRLHALHIGFQSNIHAFAEAHTSIVVASAAFGAGVSGCQFIFYVLCLHISSPLPLSRGTFSSSLSNNIFDNICMKSIRIYTIKLPGKYQPKTGILDEDAREKYVGGRIIVCNC
jgi:hypothetical protein